MKSCLITWLFFFRRARIQIDQSAPEGMPRKITITGEVAVRQNSRGNTRHKRFMRGPLTFNMGWMSSCIIGQAVTQAEQMVLTVMDSGPQALGAPPQAPGSGQPYVSFANH